MNIHGWTDNKSYVVVTADRSKRYGVAALGKRDTFDLLKGTQVALLRLFLTPKTLSSKPRGISFEVQVSPCDLYYEVWRCFVNRAYWAYISGWHYTIENIAPNLKVAITLRAAGQKTGFGFIGHPEYVPTFREIEKTLSFLLTNDQQSIVNSVIDGVASARTCTPDNQLCTVVDRYLPKPVPTWTNPGATMAQSAIFERMYMQKAPTVGEAAKAIQHSISSIEKSDEICLDQAMSICKMILVWIGEWPDDDWVSIGKNWDANLFLHEDGKRGIDIYPVVDGKTDTSTWHEVAIGEPALSVL